MFVGISQIVLLLNMCNTSELSGLFVCLERLIEVFQSLGRGTEKIAGLWFAIGDQYPG